VTQAYTGRYLPLILLLAAAETETVTLTFEEIEQLTGKPLSVTTQVGNAMWTSTINKHVRAWRAMGWRAHHIIKEQRVEWRRAAERPP